MTLSAKVVNDLLGFSSREFGLSRSTEAYCEKGFQCFPQGLSIRRKLKNPPTQLVSRCVGLVVLPVSVGILQPFYRVFYSLFAHPSIGHCIVHDYGLYHIRSTSSRAQEVAA